MNYMARRNFVKKFGGYYLENLVVVSCLAIIWKLFENYLVTVYYISGSYFYGKSDCCL
jgi:hypothetical protein